MKEKTSVLRSLVCASLVFICAMLCALLCETLSVGNSQAFAADSNASEGTSVTRATNNTSETLQEITKTGTPRIKSVYRMYNESTSEHLFTSDESEYEALVEHGWTQEDVAFNALSNGSVGVYRLYNEALGEQGKMSHHYTPNKEEADTLVRDYGWVYDFVSESTNEPEPIYYSAESYSTSNASNDITDTVNIYRLYNDGLSAHHYTLDLNERDELIQSQGWNDEGSETLAFNGSSYGKTNNEGKATLVDQSDENKLMLLKVTTVSGTTETETVSRGVNAVVYSNGAITITLPSSVYTHSSALRLNVKLTYYDDNRSGVSNRVITVLDDSLQSQGQYTTDSNGNLKIRSEATD